MLRIGLVGSGLIGWAHALGLQAMIHAQTIDAELAAVYDVDPGRAGRLADVTRGAVANTLDDLVERCDAV